MLNPNPNILLRIAQGDAFAAAAEFVGDKEHLYKFDKYYQHPGHEKLKPGFYTDDTQMSIAVAEVLLGSELDHNDNVETSLGREYGSANGWAFSEAWVRCFKRDQRDGYARGFQKFLEGVRDSYDFVDNIKPTSNRNGAAMRAVPLGVIPNVENLLEISDIQAKTTHDTMGGIFSSRIVALASHYALYEVGDLKHVESYVRQNLMKGNPPVKDLGNLEDDIFSPWMGSVPCHGISTARAILSLLKNYDNLMDMMRQTILWGGDTDSVGAIAWGIASTRYDDELPDFLEEDLEVGSIYGVSFLRNLGERLMSKYSI